jgi:hypothetical protein
MLRTHVGQRAADPSISSALTASSFPAQPRHAGTPYSDMVSTASSVLRDTRRKLRQLAGKKNVRNVPDVLGTVTILENTSDSKSLQESLNVDHADDWDGITIHHVEILHGIGEESGFPQGIYLLRIVAEDEFGVVGAGVEGVPRLL